MANLCFCTKLSKFSCSSGKGLKSRHYVIDIEMVDASITELDVNNAFVIITFFYIGL